MTKFCMNTCSGCVIITASYILDQAVTSELDTFPNSTRLLFGYIRHIVSIHIRLTTHRSNMWCSHALTDDVDGGVHIEWDTRFTIMLKV